MLKLLILAFSLVEPGFGFLELGEDGRVGVNFLGFRAGLDFGQGGVVAYSGTPFGQQANAGLRGASSDSGGALFAGASTGFGQRAEAGIGGPTPDGTARGGLFAGATTGFGQEASAGLGNLETSRTARGLSKRSLSDFAQKLFGV